MTAVPGDDTGVITLICDTCGSTANATDLLRDEDVVWPAVNDLGWSGSPFAIGTHRCPECADEAPGVEPLSLPDTTGASYDLRNIDELGTTVMTPLADLGQQMADTLRPALMSATAAGRHVVVDLHSVELIDPAGLGLLVRAHREARQHAGALFLAAPSRFVRTVLHTMRLDGVFPIFPDLATALHEGRPGRIRQTA
ncbi:STAS domain-containing protein [Actinoplanes awajinensis]|uniref:STAS domain-containing protein n=1 Tax=Actinoplanes awajinensis TaxID=135946 RepID=UPI00082CC118|nr:STAS domain-containing protein [Actinoplanes awajinensis]